MLKQALAVLFLFQTTAHLNAQSFEYSYSSFQDDIVTDAVEDFSGNYYLCGISGDFIANSYSGIIIKLNSSGDTLITRKIATNSNYLSINRLLRLNDSLFIGLGSKQDSGGMDIQLYYLRFDNSLNILEERTIGSSLYYEYVRSCILNYDSDIVIAGLAYDTSDGTTQILFSIIGMNGDSINVSYYGAPNWSEAARDLIQLPDTSAYLLFSFGWISSNPFYHTEMIQINNSGIIDTIIEINVTGPQINAKRISDTAFIISVTSTNYYDSPPFNSLNARKFDFNFTVLDSVSYGKADTNETECQSSIDFIDSSSIYVGGTSNWQNTLYSTHLGYFDVLKINSTLDKLWEKFISHNDDYLNLWKVLATSDGGVLLAGTSYNDTVNGPFERDIYVIKLDSAGNFTAGADEAGLQQHEVLVFPNPVHETLTIKAAVQLGNAEFVLFDIRGRVVLRKEFTRQITVQVNHLAPGMYIYTVTGSNGKTEKGKVVKQ